MKETLPTLMVMEKRGCRLKSALVDVENANPSQSPEEFTLASFRGKNRAAVNGYELCFYSSSLFANRTKAMNYARETYTRAHLFSLNLDVGPSPCTALSAAHYNHSKLFFVRLSVSC